MRLNDTIVRLFVPNAERTADPAVRQRYGALEAWASMALNTAMAAVKFWLGLWINSIALIADAGHTLSDTLTSIVVLIGFRTAARPSDSKHPHGHGRMESVATLIIATLLVFVGIEFLVHSIKRLLAPVPMSANWIVVAVLLVSGAIKEWMARFSEDLGQRIGSSTLTADAWHHRSDAVASLLVAAAVAGAALGYHWLDGVFGIGVSLLIMYTGVDLIRSSASYLIGESPDEAVLQQVHQTARGIPGVLALHDLEVHDYGTIKDVSLHIEVSNRANVEEAHRIATAVEQAVNRRLSASTVVHVDPRAAVPTVSPDTEVRAVIESTLRNEKQVAGFHGITVSGSAAGAGTVCLHVVVNRAMDVGRAHALGHEIDRLIAGRLKGYQVSTHVEPCDDRCTSCRNLCDRATAEPRQDAGAASQKTSAKS